MVLTLEKEDSLEETNPQRMYEFELVSRNLLKFVSFSIKRPIKWLVLLSVSDIKPFFKLPREKLY